MSLHSQFELLLHKIGRLFEFEKYKFKMLLEGKIMDPITAALNFLATPVGQKIADDLRNLNQDFLKIMIGFLQHIHDKNLPLPGPALSILPAEPITVK